MLYSKAGRLNLPMVGIGTYGLSEKAMNDILVAAVAYGTIYVDSAFRYDNESFIGNCLRNGKVKRNALILGTKLSYRQQVAGDVFKAVDDSLRNLHTDHIDLYFIHSPKSNTYCSDWKKLLEIKDSWKILELAVSNFNIEQIEQLVKATGVYPVLNQIEVHIGCYPKELIQYCKERNILVQASCPLKQMSLDLVSKDSVLKLSNKYNKTFAQLSLKWLMQHNILSIPRTQNVNHMKENFDILDFEIDERDMELIDSIT